MKVIVFKETWLTSILEEIRQPYNFVEQEKDLLDLVESYDIVFVQENMELVHELNNKQNINIIYCSNSKEDCYQALQERVSGYLLLPVEKKDIEKELANIRYGEFVKPMIRCFGKFDVFVNETAVNFPRKKAKEILAYLVYRHGELVTVDEICELIFGEANDNTRNYAYVSKFELVKTLKKAGLSNILEVDGLCYRVNTQAFECDYYQYLEGTYTPEHLIFMAQYIWAKSLLDEKVA